MNVRESILREKIDPALSVPGLSEIASRALRRPVAVRSWEVLTGGCWNRVLALSCDTGDELVLKISPERPDASLEREMRVLGCFARETTLPVPTPWLVDTSGELLPGSFLAMSRIPGVVLHHVAGMLNGAQRRAIGAQIARAVLDLHRRTARGFGGVELDPAQRIPWPDFWIPRFDRVVERIDAAGLVSRRFLQEVRAVGGELPRLLGIGEQSTLTHYDIWAGNVMVALDRGTARVTGYLDAPGYWADPVREFSFMEMFGLADAPFYELYLAAHPLDAGWELRKSIYNLKMHLTHVMMYPQESYYRDGAQACLSFATRRV